MAAKNNFLTRFNKKWLLLAALPLTAAVWKITDEFTMGYYHRPLGAGIELAANFGEIREGHFHMGLDIRTNGKENLPVYAAADGFISRASIEEGGYGRALYITHPNGVTSVYAHLNRFRNDVEKYVRDNQYREECWQQDIIFEPGKFVVTKGERIALSGNTGNSEGPHLHFELRDTKTGFNINPLMNGVNITDKVAPVITGLYWYNKTGSIYTATANKINIKETSGWHTSSAEIVKVTSPNICFGISATDKNAESKFKFGIYKALLFVDDKERFAFTINSFNGNSTRYVNACIDYSSFITYSKKIQLLCILPGNKLPVFEGSPGNGVIHLLDNKPHRIKILVSDVSGNTAVFTTLIRYEENKTRQKTKQDEIKLLPNKPNHITTANAEINFSARALYDTLPVHISEESTSENNAASKAIFIHAADVPVHDSFMVKLKTTLLVNDPLRKHLVIQLTNEKHRIIIKGKWQGGYMAGHLTEFGTVQLIIDTINPTINLLEGNNNIFNDDNKALHITYADNMGGPAFFRGELDGRWVMFEKKGNLFTYYFDEHCKPGNHTLKIMAGDKANNITQQAFNFSYR